VHTISAHDVRAAPILHKQGLIYESMDEIGRLKYSIEKMNLNKSPIFGVEKAKDLGFKEAVDFAEVRRAA
jgi:hypothetical protein